VGLYAIQVAALNEEHRQLVVQLGHAVARRDMWATAANEILLPLVLQREKDMERERQTVSERLDAAQLQVRCASNIFKATCRLQITTYASNCVHCVH
jgi:hypothetical protein